MKVKLVIWDLDNTLWDGTVFYKDKEAVTIKPGTKAALKELGKRSIECSVCSKNYVEDATNKLEELGIKKYFTDFEIGWGLKSDSIRKIIEKKKVDPSEVLFIDDDGFQREEVMCAIPGINAIELKDPLDVLNVEGIMVEKPTDTDLKRVILLKQQRDRETAGMGRKKDFKEFLLECDMKMTVRLAQPDDLPRIVQLLNRTNELNATNNRYNLEDVKREHETGEIKIFVIDLTDKFGDYGLIAEAITTESKEECFIRDLTVSCRTMGRGIGGALLISILEYCKANSIPRVRGYVDTSESNWRMKPLFEKRDFKPIGEEGNKSYYLFDLGKQTISEYPKHLRVITNFGGEK